MAKDSARIVLGEKQAEPPVVRESVRIKRDELFRTGKWRNNKGLTPLLSRTDEESLVTLIEWCDEFGTEIGKFRERLSDPDPRIKERKGQVAIEE